MKLFVLLVGMVMILEGLPYVAAPEAMQQWLLKLSEKSPQALRKMGVAMMVVGLVICWVVQRG